MQQHANKIIPEIRKLYSQSLCSDELLALGDSQIRKEPEEINKRKANRSLAHIFWFAVVGSLTQNGGVIRYVSGTSTAGGYRMARAGDKVLYADGSKATIISGAGKARVMQRASAAPVDSMLDNDDEIISTPQCSVKLVFGEGHELPEGFLTMSGSKH